MNQLPSQAPFGVSPGTMSFSLPLSNVNNIQSTELRVMRTPFHYEYWNLIAETSLKEEHFFAVPYNGRKLAPEQDIKYPPVNPKGKYPFCVNIKSEGTGLSDSKVISGLTEVKDQRDEKTPNVLVISGPTLTTVEHEFSRDLVGPRHLDGCITGHNLSQIKEPYETEEKPSELYGISEEKSLDEFSFENRNPNARGRACVSCETSRSDTSLGSNSLECTKDMVVSLTSSHHTLSDESCVPDFLVNSPSSESKLAFREKKLLMISPRNKE